MTTLREALTQAKPFLRCGLKPRNTRGTDWPRLQEEHTNFNIEVWNEFTVENLTASYGHVLDMPIAEGELDVPDSATTLANVEIKKPQDINQLLMWCDGVLRPTLEYARQKLHIETGTSLNHDCATPESWRSNVRLSIRNKEGTGRVKMDHLVQLDEWKAPILVFGVGRPSRSFPVRQLPLAASAETVWPLRQLANMCLHSQTRFGYILTEQDLTVCCFSAADRAEAKSTWSVAVMAIPWTKAGKGQLTTDLALWWLSMLAISEPRNRKLTSKEHSLRIDHWDVFRHEDERGWVRRHKYSKFEEPADEPLPPAYQSPSPDNGVGMVAAYHANVGINAAADFELFPADGNDAFAGVNNNLDNLENLENLLDLNVGFL